MRWVVVGAGSAGCVVAARLTEAGEEVVLVEAGPSTTADASHSPSFFDAVAEAGRTFPEPFLRGRGVGGSSAVNGMIATPGSDVQYRSWGWNDWAEALSKVRVPFEPAGDDDLGPMDRALLATVPDAIRPPLTRRVGRRVTAFDAYLVDRNDGRGVDLRAETPASRIAFDDDDDDDVDRAVGVELEGGGTIEADAVVVSAGAIGSPLLLLASGVDGPHVGAHLRNHAALAVDLHLRSGVANDPHGLVAGTLLRRADLQLLSVNHLGPGAPGMAGFLVVAMASTGEGRVQLDEPHVEQVVSALDRERLEAGVRLVQELLGAPAFRAIVDDVTVGTPPAGVYHPTSTCRMGDVVDDDGAVIGRRDLFVVDASIFPELPAANPYLPTLVLAERLVGRVRARRASHAA
ncbi:MAG: GMC family oxidoreductase N-terminal domain-containing protein [Ilumatobacteraceae bacterium]